MELRQLEHLVAVVDVGSIGKAAQRLGLTQPALTQSLRRLERGLDLALLERGPRGVAPTEAGRTLAARARVIVLEARRAQAEMDAVSERVRGRLAIGCGPSLAAALVPAAVAQLLARYPRLAVTIREGTLDILLPELEQGVLDLAVGTRPEPFAQRGMEADTLMRDRMVIAARSRHPLVRRRAPALRDTLDFPWILPAVGDVVRARVEAVFEAAGLAPPAPVVQTNSAAAIRGLLHEGDFLTFVPGRLIDAAARDGTLAALRIAGTDWTREVHVLSRAGALHPAGRLFVSLLRRSCGAGAPAGRGAAHSGGVLRPSQ
jgi:DNA-binding transcriptional LysR family regulator